MHWLIHAGTSIGGRKEQQDRLSLLTSPEQDQHLLILADGAGGHSNGARAAQIVVDFAHDSADDLWQSTDPEQSLEHFCQHAHIRVLALSENQDIACTTLVILLLRGNEAYWAHLGDSRLYLIRDNRIIVKTRDHSLRQLAVDQAESGANAEKYREQSIPANQLYMCLGIPGDINPEIGASSLQPGDRFLMCSDGLWGHLDLDGMIESLPALFSQSFCDSLIEKARIQNGADGDNISLILAQAEAKTGAIFAFFKALSALFKSSGSR